MSRVAALSLKADLLLPLLDRDAQVPPFQLAGPGTSRRHSAETPLARKGAPASTPGSADGDAEADTAPVRDAKTAGDRLPVMEMLGDRDELIDAEAEADADADTDCTIGWLVHDGGRLGEDVADNELETVADDDCDTESEPTEACTEGEALPLLLMEAVAVSEPLSLALTERLPERLEVTELLGPLLPLTLDVLLILSVCDALAVAEPLVLLLASLLGDTLGDTDQLGVEVAVMLSLPLPLGLTVGDDETDNVMLLLPVSLGNTDEEVDGVESTLPLHDALTLVLPLLDDEALAVSLELELPPPLLETLGDGEADSVEVTVSVADTVALLEPLVVTEGEAYVAYADPDGLLVGEKLAETEDVAVSLAQPLGEGDALKLPLLLPPAVTDTLALPLPLPLPLALPLALGVP